MDILAETARNLGMMPGLSIDIVPPFAAYLLGSFAFYVNSDRALDFPMGGEIGLEYRF